MASVGGSSGAEKRKLVRFYVSSYYNFKPVVLTQADIFLENPECKKLICAKEVEDKKKHYYEKGFSYYIFFKRNYTHIF